MDGKVSSRRLKASKMTSTRDLLHLAHNSLSRALAIIENKELKVRDVALARENAGVALAKLLDVERRMIGAEPPKTGD